ncbi:MAG: DUF4139 domain-containing protein [Gemmataceae bacterium]|nr:DUF4139 domain-containing protein [Gemmataceae bacterium]
MPLPVHGTYYVEANAPVETRVRMREVDVKADETTPGNLQDDLAGKRVTVHFKSDRRAPVVGTMLKLKPPKGDEAGMPPGRFLLIQTTKGRVYVDAAEVATVEADDAGDTVKRTRPRLVLTLGATDNAETKVTIRYLARGLAWAPSYRIDTTDAKTLALEQRAVIRNELADLTEADLRLISGYPSVQFAHVHSPLSPRTTWGAFFGELNNSAYAHGRNNDVTMNQVVSQNPIGNYRGVSDLAIGATPTGEGVDLHYQPVGRRSLETGEAVELAVAKGKADYERVVEWSVPDTRDEYGHSARGGRGPGDDDEPWDALKFKNPLAFPLTTGPATVTAGGAFNGQRTVYWTNAGEETMLRVNKALSVRTRAVENEQQGKDGGSTRDVVWIGGRQYRKVTVDGELTVSNHRKETLSLVLRRRFSGEIVQAEGAPKVALREEGVVSVNRRQELRWAFPLKPGEERTLKYTYTVLVSH